MAALSPKVEPIAEGEMTDQSAQVPALRFDQSKVTDHGSIPIVYRYDPPAGLVELGGDIDGEIAAMYQSTSRETDMYVSLNPLYIAPSRKRFRLTEGGVRGTAKEYAVLTVSLTQRQGLPVINSKLLTWAASWSLVEGTQDVPEQGLSAPVGSDTFENMILPRGDGLLGVEFTTGTAGGGGLSGIFAGAEAIAGDKDLAKLLPAPASALEATTSYLNAIGGLISQFGSHQDFKVDLAAGGGLRVAAHSHSQDARLTGVLRLPSKPTKFLFTPSNYASDFKQALAHIRANGQNVVLDSDTGAPTVVDAQGNPIPTSTNQPRGLLSDFTLIVLETLVSPLES